MTAWELRRPRAWASRPRRAPRRRRRRRGERTVHEGPVPTGGRSRAERGQLAQRGPQASQADARLVDDVRRFRSFGHFTGIGQNLLQTIAQHRSHQRGAIGIPVDRQRLGLRW